MLFRSILGFNDFEASMISGLFSGGLYPVSYTHLVEITDEGVVRGVFSLTEEIESVEWMPGVIVLLSESQVEEIKNTGMLSLIHI